MRSKLLIIPDKFKGTLSAQEAGVAIERGWRSARPQDSIRVVPFSDGGDGFGDVLSGLLGAEVQRTSVADAAHRRRLARWWWDQRRKTALIESATAVGLAMLPAKQYHPFQLDTFGLGLLLRAAVEKGARCCLVGIGGSATNDAGFGMARALGWGFLDRNGRAITRWIDLQVLERLQAPQWRRLFPELLVAVDVENPLLGSRGASRVYGPQKGLRPQDFARTERCLRRVAEVVRGHLGKDYARVPGAGAAGGLGFGLMAFAGARLEPGFGLFRQLADLDRSLRAANLVLTGEGRIDASTFMGKGVGEIAGLCRARKVPCLGFGGTVSLGSGRKNRFTRTFALTDVCSRSEAEARAGFWLERLARQAAEAWQPGACTPGKAS